MEQGYSAWKKDCRIDPPHHCSFWLQMSHYIRTSNWLLLWTWKPKFKKSAVLFFLSTVWLCDYCYKWSLIFLTISRYLRSCHKSSRSDYRLLSWQCRNLTRGTFPAKCDGSVCTSLTTDVSPLKSCMTDPSSADCTGRSHTLKMMCSLLLSSYLRLGSQPSRCRVR